MTPSVDFAADFGSFFALPLGVDSGTSVSPLDSCPFVVALGKADPVGSPGLTLMSFSSEADIFLGTRCESSSAVKESVTSELQSSFKVVLSIKSIQ